MKLVQNAEPLGKVYHLSEILGFKNNGEDSKLYKAVEACSTFAII